MAFDRYHAPFISNYFYHVYNRTINNDLLFYSDENYNYFLRKWEKYIASYLDVYSYCLQPTHFHFLVKVKDTDNDQLNENILDGFKRFLGGYSLAINKQQNRHGSLMQKRFKRIVIESDNYLLSLIHYIHHNPIHHGLTDSFLRLGTIHRTIQLYHRDKQRLREKNS